MDQQQQRKRDLRGVSAVVAVIVALMGFSATLANNEDDGALPVAAQAAPAHADPSLAGLSVSADADARDIVDLQF